MNQVSVQRQFDEKDFKYFCCWGGYHVLTGTKIIAGIHSALIALCVATLAYELLSGIWWIDIVGKVFPLLIHIVINGCLWRGVLREREGYLIPFMVQTMFNIVVAVYYLIVLLGLILDYTSFKRYTYGLSFEDEKHIRLSLWQLLFLVLVVLALYIWFFLIVKKAYNCIQYKRFVKMCRSDEFTQEAYVAVPQVDTPPPAYEREQRVWMDSTKINMTYNSNTSGLMKAIYSPLQDV